MQDIGIFLGKTALEFIAYKEECNIDGCESILEMIAKLLKNRVEKIEKVEKVETTQSLLEKYGIKTSSDMKIWLIKNHPDRGGDSEIFIKILTEFRKRQKVK